MPNIETLPPYKSYSFAKWLGEATEKYFENPDVKRRFEEWKREKARKEEALCYQEHT